MISFIYCRQTFTLYKSSVSAENKCTGLNVPEVLNVHMNEIYKKLATIK